VPEVDDGAGDDDVLLGEAAEHISFNTPFTELRSSIVHAKLAHDLVASANVGWLHKHAVSVNVHPAAMAAVDAQEPAHEGKSLAATVPCEETLIAWPSKRPIARMNLA